MTAEPFLHGPEEPRGWRARVDALVASLPTFQRCPPTWDETEFYLKASVYSDERVLIMGWVLAWLRSIEAAGTCFPRLHVVSDLPEEASAWRGLFRGVPNVTVHALRYPFEMDAYYAIQWPMMWADNFTAAHTRHIFVLDTDSPPVLPLRCHQLFDRQERPLWAVWPNLGLRWVGCSDAIVSGLVRGAQQRWPSLAPVHGLLANTSVPSSSPFLGYLRQLGTGSTPRRRGGGGGGGGGGATATDSYRRGHDLMAFFPVIIPRRLLSPVRALLSAACAAGLLDGLPGGHPPPPLNQEQYPSFAGLQHGRQLRQDGACGDFDRVWLALQRPSYADLLGKLAPLLPSALDAPIRWLMCPDARDVESRAANSLKGTSARANSKGPLAAVSPTAPAAAAAAASSCRDYVRAAPHLKYPGHAGQRRSLTRAEAAAWGARLSAAGRAFVRGEGPLPPELLYYNLSRSPALLDDLARRWRRPDDPTRVCGSGSGRARSSRGWARGGRGRGRGAQVLGGGPRRGVQVQPQRHGSRRVRR